MCRAPLRPLTNCPAFALDPSAARQPTPPPPASPPDRIPGRAVVPVALALPPARSSPTAVPLPPSTAAVGSVATSPHDRGWPRARSAAHARSRGAGRVAKSARLSTICLPHRLSVCPQSNSSNPQPPIPCPTRSRTYPPLRFPPIP